MIGPLYGIEKQDKLPFPAMPRMTRWHGDSHRPVLVRSESQLVCCLPEGLRSQTRDWFPEWKRHPHPTSSRPCGACREPEPPSGRTAMVTGSFSVIADSRSSGTPPDAATPPRFPIAGCRTCLVCVVEQATDVLWQSMRKHLQFRRVATNSLATVSTIAATWTSHPTNGTVPASLRTPFVNQLFPRRSDKIQATLQLMWVADAVH